MHEEQIEPRPYLKLLVLAAVLGIASAVMTFVFEVVVNGGQTLIWQQAVQATGLPQPIFTFLVCTLGGLVVGVLVKIFGDHTGIFAELLANFGVTGRFDYRHAPGIVITALASLVSGASLGPEAPMADACGGLGTLAAEKLKLDERETRALGFSGFSGMLAALLTSPFGGALLSIESARGRADYVWMLFPTLVSSAFATVVYVLFTKTFLGTLYAFPDYEPTLMHLLLAVPLGLVGALAGVIFIVMLHRLRRLMLPLKNHLILRGVIGGMVLGIAGALLPLTLFSGKDQTVQLINQAPQLGMLMLLALALVKLLITPMCLATGWKGGYIFPTMFAATALGLAVNTVFPGIPVAVAVAATMAGSMVAIFKAPIWSALFVLLFVQHQTSPVVAIAVIVGLLATTRFSIVQPPKPVAQPAQTAAGPASPAAGA